MKCSHEAWDNSHCCFLSYYNCEYLLILLYSHRFMAGWVSSFSPLSAARVVNHWFEHTHASITFNEIHCASLLRMRSLHTDRQAKLFMLISRGLNVFHRFFVMSIIIFTVSGPRVLPTSIFPSGSFSPSSTTVWRMEYDQAVSAVQSCLVLNLLIVY